MPARTSTILGDIPLDILVQIVRDPESLSPYVEKFRLSAEAAEASRAAAEEATAKAAAAGADADERAARLKAAIEELNNQRADFDEQTHAKLEEIRAKNEDLMHREQELKERTDALVEREQALSVRDLEFRATVESVNNTAHIQNLSDMDLKTRAAELDAREKRITELQAAISAVFPVGDK